MKPQMDNDCPIPEFGVPTVGFCEAVRWTVPKNGAKDSSGIYHDRDWWETLMLDRLHGIEEEFDPDGFMLLENKMLDSHKLGRRFVLPFGGRSTHRRVPEQPFSIDGLASGTVCVVGIYKRVRYE